MNAEAVAASRAANLRAQTADAAGIIRRIQANGPVSRRKIADALTALGIPAPRGQIWLPEHVKRVLELADGAAA